MDAPRPPARAVDIRQRRTAAPPIAVCAIILRRRSRWDGCQRLFWDTIAIGIGLWIIGHFGWAFDEMFLGRQSWLQWHTVFSLCGGIGPLIALLARPHRGVRSDEVGTVGLALASYGLLVVFIYSYFVLVPGVRDPQVALVQLVQVNRALLFGSMISATIVARRTSGTARTFISPSAQASASSSASRRAWRS